MASFNGLGMGLGTLSRLSTAETRSISPENLTGERGKGGLAVDGPAAKCARDLGRGWKISPFRVVKPGETQVLADIEGSGAIQHIWLTPTGHWRFSILRVYWDGQEQPSVECPVGDFFACGWNRYAPVSSLAVCVNPGSAFNCYWEMPFRRRCRITLENIAAEEMRIFWQIDYTLTQVPEDAAYFHAQFRRVNPLPYKEVVTILDGVKGRGHFVGTYLAWGVNNNNWWGEGEIKFYLDDDREFPTICGTGTEDYFCGSYDFEIGSDDPVATRAGGRRYQEFTTPNTGLAQVIRPDGLNSTQTRFGMYRWHIMDPVRFANGIRVTIQALGWRSGGRYLPLRDDIASTAFWYQALPTAAFPRLPGKDSLEVI
ncbi:MAG: hypothetical protein A2177_11650 [Spirochaetes bacterium RBG_13_68_11]|nr:MAG: hypothetical protein A2177_11650 [Spirochaetes bacterium RBG_13_68_11]